MLVDLYVKQIRSLVEYATPVWNPGLTQSNKSDIERVQKTALAVIFNEKSYTKRLQLANIASLDTRRDDICKKFANKTLKNPKFNSWFQTRTNVRNTRLKRKNFEDPIARCKRFENSPIPYLTRLLNSKE